MMAHIAQLQPWLGYEKTLLITCHECTFDFSQRHREQVFVYTCLGGMLRKDDHFQQDCIRHYLDDKACSQIIIVGHYDCQVLQKILSESFVPASQAFFQYNLEGLQRAYAQPLLKPRVKNRLLAELNVVEQLRLLMRFPCVQEKLNDGLINISGVMLDGHVVKEIFRNGISFNNLMACN
jgi:carbonic anhydrase